MSVATASHSSGGYSSRAEMDFAHIEKSLPTWQNRPYGEISTLTGLTRSRVKNAIRWAATNRDDIVVSAPIPGRDNRVRVVEQTDKRSLEGISHLGKHATTRTRNVGKRYRIASKNHPDPAAAAGLADIAETVEDLAKMSQRMQRMASMIEDVTSS